MRNLRNEQETHGGISKVSLYDVSYDSALLLVNHSFVLKTEEKIKLHHTTGEQKQTGSRNLLSYQG